ncbi:hypothetical protein GGI11_006707, partial [Coemansia sp. RSA 2049]
EGAGKAPEFGAGTSTSVPKAAESQDVLIAGIHDPDSLDGLSQTTDKCDIKFEQLLESFRISVPKFSGDVRQDHLSTRNWVRLIANWRREVLGSIDNLLFIAEIRRLLSGLAQRVIGRSVFAQPAEILSTIQREFPHGQFQRELVKLIESGEAFANCDGPELMTRLDEYIAELEDSTFGMMAIAEAIQELFPNYWEFLDLPESNITSADLIACTQEIRRRLYCSRKAKATPYDKMIVLAKPKVTESPKSALVGTSKTSSNGHAAVSLITRVCAEKLGLNIRQDRQQRLCSPFSSEVFTSFGTARARIGITDGPKIWTWLTVIDIEQPWELLLGSVLLKKLDIQLMTPAMRRQMVKRGQVTDDSHSFGVAETADAGDKSEVMKMPTDADYEAVADSIAALATDIELKSVEMCTDAETDERTMVTTLRPRRLRAKLGLTGDFFIYQRDDDLVHWDAKYPAATRESVEQRIVHQLNKPAQAKQLIDMLIAKGATTLREYPSGCPPPAAIAPIRPPMSEHAKLVFTLQHPMSEAAHQTREEFVATRIEYGIDEPTTAYSQMPIFTVPKPNTTARRVIFDDTTNNELNMLHLGIQLPSPIERVQFLSDAKRISSIDLGSFFTTIRLSSDVRDFWCYQGGSRGRLRTARMVQGNSESPAIAQAFFEHVFADVSRLKETLQQLPMPRTITQIQRMAGGINAISDHIPWVQAALLPFYLNVGQKRLTKADIEELTPKWKDLQEALLDTRSLYIPPHGAPLTIRVDAAGAGIGAVLLAHEVPLNADVEAVIAPEEEKLRPVAFFSKVFDGVQGYRHSTWREAKAVVEAV